MKFLNLFGKFTKSLKTKDLFHLSLVMIWIFIISFHYRAKWHGECALKVLYLENPTIEEKNDFKYKVYIQFQYFLTWTWVKKTSSLYLFTCCFSNISNFLIIIEESLANIIFNVCLSGASITSNKTWESCALHGCLYGTTYSGYCLFVSWCA